MTLVYTSPGFLGTSGGSPIRCSSPIAFCTLENKSNMVDTHCLVRSPSPSFKTKTDWTKNGKLRLSLEDVSLTVLSRNVPVHQSPLTTGKDCSFTVNKRPGNPRSILKKSASADCASLASLRDVLLTTTKRLSFNLSDSSLSSIQTFDEDAGDMNCPTSPTKNVTFADDNNLSLVEIHNFAPSCDSLDKLQITFPRTSFLSSRVNVSASLVPSKCKNVKKPELLLCFQEPRESPDFIERFKYRCVALERCATRDRTLSGIVVVQNIEYEKRVCVRYTLDRWKTSDELQACYVPNSSDGETDRFSFDLMLPKNERELEFAIRYNSGSSEFWDNNFNRNYKVKDANLKY